jgi:hypothetical protein
MFLCSHVCNLQRVWGDIISYDPNAGWPFHVVLEVDGKIIDPDYHHGEDAEVPKVYFERMFGKAAKEKPLRVRPIPAADYKRDYKETWLLRDRGHFWYSYGAEAERIYPGVDLKAFVNSTEQ